MDTYTIGWLVWILSFALLEGTALAKGRRGATFSEHIWRWFRVGDPRPTSATWALRVPLLIGLVWLLGHLGFGWWTPSNPHPLPW